MRNFGCAPAVIQHYIFTLVSEIAQYPAQICKGSHYKNSVHLLISRIIANLKQNTSNSKSDDIIEKHDQQMAFCFELLHVITNYITLFDIVIQCH